MTNMNCVCDTYRRHPRLTVKITRLLSTALEREFITNASTDALAEPPESLHIMNIPYSDEAEIQTDLKDS